MNATTSLPFGLKGNKLRPCLNLHMVGGSTYPISRICARHMQGLVRLTISLIGNIISLSLAFRVCEELESADELDINVKEEINVFLFKAVKHVLHGLIYEQDDECFNTGTKPIGITKVSGLSIDDLLCCERRKCPILLQIFHGLNYNSGGFARVLKRQKILSPLVSFIEAEKDNLWEQID